MGNRSENNSTKIILLLSVGLFIASLTQPAYCTNDCKNALMVFLFGPLGMLTEIGAMTSWILEKVNADTNSLSNDFGATFSWLANPLLLISFFIFRHSKRKALTLSIISTLLILLFMTFEKVLDNEAGHYNKITELKLGYWLWLLSSVSILIGSLILKPSKLYKEKKKRP